MKKITFEIVGLIITILFAVIFRKQIGADISHLRHPNSSVCGLCKYAWPDLKEHFVLISDGWSIFALCEKCWNNLTPKERLPYYVKLYRSWNEKEDREQLLRNQILGWAEPTAFGGPNYVALQAIPNDLLPGFWSDKEIIQARKEGWANPRWSTGEEKTWTRITMGYLSRATNVYTNMLNLCRTNAAVMNEQIAFAASNCPPFHIIQLPPGTVEGALNIPSTRSPYVLKGTIAEYGRDRFDESLNTVFIQPGAKCTLGEVLFPGTTNAIKEFADILSRAGISK
jgi:hypothetical protein